MNTHNNRLIGRYRRERNVARGQNDVDSNTILILKIKLADQERQIKNLQHWRKENHDYYERSQEQIRGLRSNLDRIDRAFKEGRQEIEMLAESLLKDPAEPVLQPMIRIAVRDVLLRKSQTGSVVR